MVRTVPIVLLLLVLSSPAWSAEPVRDFAACEALFASGPETEEPARCFEETGTALGRRDEAADRLRSLLGKHQDNPWLSLHLGHLETDGSEALYRAAAEGFARRGEPRGEVSARTNLQRVLVNEGRLEEAEAQVELAEKVAVASKDPMLLARVQITQARQLFTQGMDLERAYLLLRRAEAALFPGGDPRLQRSCLLGLARVSLALGRFAEAREAYRHAAELTAAEGDLNAEATARYGLARMAMDSRAEVPREEDRLETLRLAREALEVAIRGGNKDVESKAHWILGLLTPGEEGRRHLDRCLAAAEVARDYSHCLNALARHLAAEDPQEAQKTIDKALEFSRQAEDYWSMAFSWHERMRVSWAAGPLERAIADSQSALDAIEALRDLQAGSDSSQAGLFSMWAEDYYWLAGRLFEEGAAENLAQGFRVMERMRARGLIDTLEAARALPAAATGVRQQRAAVLEHISGVQRRLLDPDLPAAERTAANQELERLEMEEADLRNRLNREDPAFATLRRPEFATLAEVQRLLAPDEALLSFQIASWKDIRGDFAGGSWLLVVTRTTARIHRLPSRGELRPAVRLFTGTFESRDGAEVRPSVHLYQQLLGPALAELPGSIGRLLIIPDDTLHRLPFGALRAASEAPPLAVRYELALVPSATLWRAWEADRFPPAAIPALALADPPTPGEDDEAMAVPAPARERSAAVFSAAVRLGSLPFAREESRAVVRQLGGGSQRRLGEEASEAFLKATDLSRFGILHFAAHAVTDETNPERSGVLLASGAKDDGLLQIREIVDLDLRGRVVVLSSCRSNAGAVLRGEGVMSLARAFFQAGAHTVVASLWPLRDDEAALVFERFYRHLGRGVSVSAALRAAQSDSIAAGLPAAAWAGIVVLGDGEMVPLPGGRRGLPAWAWPVGGTTLALGLLLGGGVLLRRRAGAK